MRHSKYLIPVIGLIIFIVGCADHIVSECEECNPIVEDVKLNTFNGIQIKLFDTTCVLSGCHGSKATQANLLLTPGELLLCIS